MKRIFAMLVCFALAMATLCGCGLNIVDKNIGFGIGVSNYTYANASEYTAASDFSVDTAVESITEIEVDWVAGDVTVKVIDGGKINVSETGAENEDDVMRYRVSKGTLDIKWRAKGRHDGTLKKSVTIEIPESLAGKLDFEADLVSADIKADGLKLTELSVDTVSGEATFTDCSAEEISIESVSGDVDLSECTAEELEIDNVSGRIRVGRVFKKGRIETVSGRVIFKCTETLEELRVDSVSGDVDIVTDVKPKSVDVETISGKTTYYGEKKGSDGFETTDGNGAGEVKIVTVSGDVDFDIAQ